MAVRGTLDSSKALTMGFGIQEGRVLVEDARFKVVQRQRSEKKGGGLVTPMLFLQLDCKKLNENNVAESDAIETTDLLVAFGSKATGENGLHSFALWPGMLKGDPADPNAEVESLHEEMADETRAYVRIDTEGNTFVSANGAVPFADSEAMLFMKSLESKGWKAEINGQCFAGNYKGMVIDVRTVLKEDLCKRLGVKYTAPKDADPNRPATLWEVVAVHVRPYEKGSNKKGAAAAAAKGGKSTSASAGTNGSEKSAGDDKAKAAFEEFVRSKAGKTLTQVELQKAVGPFLMQKVGLAAAQAFVNANVKPLESLAALGFELGFDVDADAKSVTFSAAE